jgi:hypothetical protein
VRQQRDQPSMRRGAPAGHLVRARGQG